MKHVYEYAMSLKDGKFYVEPFFLCVCSHVHMCALHVHICVIAYGDQKLASGVVPQELFTLFS